MLGPLAAAGDQSPCGWRKEHGRKPGATRRSPKAEPTPVLSGTEDKAQVAHQQRPNISPKKEGPFYTRSPMDEPRGQTPDTEVPEPCGSTGMRSAGCQICGGRRQVVGAMLGRGLGLGGDPAPGPRLWWSQCPQDIQPRRCAPVSPAEGSSLFPRVRTPVLCSFSAGCRGAPVSALETGPLRAPEEREALGNSHGQETKRLTIFHVRIPYGAAASWGQMALPAGMSE